MKDLYLKHRPTLKVIIDQREIESAERDESVERDLAMNDELLKKFSQEQINAAIYEHIRWAAISRRAAKKCIVDYVLIN